MALYQISNGISELTIQIVVKSLSPRHIDNSGLLVPKCQHKSIVST